MTITRPLLTLAGAGVIAGCLLPIYWSWGRAEYSWVQPVAWVCFLVVVAISGAGRGLATRVVCVLHKYEWPLLAVAGAGVVAGCLSSIYWSWGRAEYSWVRWMTWGCLLVVSLVISVGWAIPGGQRPADAPRPLADPPPVAPRSGGNTPFTRFLSGYLEPCLGWLLVYPLFLPPFIFFCLVSWGGLGAGFGFPDLLWDEGWWARFWAGVSVSLLFCNLLFIRAMLDQRQGSFANPLNHLSADGWSLFWFARTRRHARIRQLGRFLLVSWPITLAAFYLPKMLSPVWCELGAPVSMFLGLLGGVAITLLLVWLYCHRFSCGMLDLWWRKRRLVRTLPGFSRYSLHRIPFPDRPLHGLGGLMIAIPAFFLVVLQVENGVFGAVWSPIWLLCLIIGSISAVSGFLAFHFDGLKFVLALLVVCLLVVSSASQPYKMSFPGLEGYGVDSERGELVDLDHYEAAPHWEADFKAVDLIRTEDMLVRFKENWRKKDPSARADQKPKLVIVASTGGGIVAAVWTGVVLEGLEQELSAQATGGGAIRDHIRLMTGASGGMQAAGLYAADFENYPKKSKTQLSDQLARDSLWPTAQTMLAHDFPRIASPERYDHDRGRRLEGAWEFNTHPWGGDPPDSLDRAVSSKLREEARNLNSPLGKRFADLRAGEAECTRPSIVFAPMLVEDCRRLLISNLDMRWFTSTNASNLNPPLAGIPRERLSVPAVEFWRLFPRAYRGNGTQSNGFKVVTAARMSATFPFVGPAVSLPTSPSRRVVDAGYFDNFGINVASHWLLKHKQAIREHTSGVVIVEIRAYPRRLEKLLFDPDAASTGPAVRDDEASSPGGTVPKSQAPSKEDLKRKEELLGWAMSELGTPAEAVINLYAKAAYFRNDQFLDALDTEFNSPPSFALQGAVGAFPPQNRFFTTVAFECEHPAALSWTLPARDLRKIRANFAAEDRTLNGKVVEQIRNLRAWFGSGGGR